MLIDQCFCALSLRACFSHISDMCAWKNKRILCMCIHESSMYAEFEKKNTNKYSLVDTVMAH